MEERKTHLKLSVVMPMYNVEQYVGRSIESVLKGGLSEEEWELIVVNDGSTDGCEDTVMELEKESVALKELAKHENWHYVRQDNRGLSEARNRGLSEAKGEYVIFVDSDDYMEKGALRRLMDVVEDKQLDLLRFNYRTVDENGAEVTVCKAPKKYIDFSCVATDGKSFLDERLGYACYAWQFVVRRSLLEGCLFTPNIYFEDTDWTPRMLMKAKRCASTDWVAYNYTQRVGSITKSVEQSKIEKLLRDKKRLLWKLAEWYRIDPIKWYQTMACRTALSIFNDPDVQEEEKLEVVKKMREEGIYPLTTHDVPFPKVIRVWMLNYLPRWYFRHMV